MKPDIHDASEFLRPILGLVSKVLGKHQLCNNLIRWIEFFLVEQSFFFNSGEDTVEDSLGRFRNLRFDEQHMAWLELGQKSSQCRSATIVGKLTELKRKAIGFKEQKTTYNESADRGVDQCSTVSRNSILKVLNQGHQVRGSWFDRQDEVLIVVSIENSVSLCRRRCNTTDFSETMSYYSNLEKPNLLMTLSLIFSLFFLASNISGVSVCSTRATLYPLPTSISAYLP